MTQEERETLGRLLDQIDENDNNYVFIGKLRNDFNAPSHASLRLTW